MAEPVSLRLDTCIMVQSLLSVRPALTRCPVIIIIFTPASQLTIPALCSIAHVVKTGRWAGVVTAFITMSDIRDEIDWEFPGAATTEGQSNFFWQGVIRM